MIEYDDGIHLKETDLWFDSKKRVPLSFISNASISQFSSHKKIIATPQTIRLIGKRVRNSLVLPCPFNRPFTLGRLQIELVPAGSILGSSQVVVDLNDKRLIYTGDIKLRPSETSEHIVVRHCDILIMKSTYGKPGYVFPPTADVMDSIKAFARSSLSSGYVPIILVDPLGKAQDIIKELGNEGFKLSLSKSIYNTLKIYEEFGFTFSNYESFNPSRLEGRVFIIPPHLRGSERIEGIERRKIGVVMGWAIDKPYAKSVFRSDEAFPLSNHAGYDELIQYVELARPKEVYLVQGFSTEFSRTLKRRGYNAKPLEKPTQLELL